MAPGAAGGYHGVPLLAKGIAMDHALDQTHVAEPGALPAPEPQVRQVPLGAPLQWLRLGARDLQRSLRPSLWVGAAVAAAGWLLMFASWKVSYLAPTLLAGFLFIAPFAAIPIYGYSRQLERGDPVDGSQARRAWRANAQSIALFGLMLAVALIFWERLAAILFAMFYRGEPLHLSTLLVTLLFSGAHLPLVLAWGVVGGLLAAVVFSLTVVSAPLLLDRPVDVVTAAITSVRCCLRNPLPMLLWAALIALVTWVGLATFMLGLLVAFPWLAHASWHAYRGLVETGQ
jgi:uncharacterized membrane protein